MISSLELARQLAIYSYKTKTKDIGSIAEAAGFPAIYMMNALYEGEDKGLFTIKRTKKDLFEKLEVTDEQYDDIAKGTLSTYGDEFKEIADKALEIISWLNKEEKALNIDIFHAWVGVTPFVWENLMTYLLESGLVYQHKITDSKDSRSTYYFLTLMENKDKSWHLKQFKKSQK